MQSECKHTTVRTVRHRPKPSDWSGGRHPRIDLIGTDFFNLVYGDFCKKVLYLYKILKSFKFISNQIYHFLLWLQGYILPKKG